MASFRFSPRPNRAHEINWTDWGPAAFQRAQQEDRPLLLSISAVWCHWCHVMDETSYSDPEVIRLINESFIPVRVDNDQRPDVNQRYNMGGWPSTAVLTPTGDIVTGGTYIPPQQLRDVLSQVAFLYRGRKAELQQRAREITDKKLERLNQVVAGRAIEAEIVDTATRMVASTFDPVYGGFGSQPKFPMTEALELLLDSYAASADPWYMLMVRKTLDHMASGGLFDQVEGGFFRYSTTREWSVPHFEKMLEDNAQLVRVYVRAYLLTGDQRYREVAERAIAYLDRRLFSPEVGAFFGSQDAEEEYYALDSAGRAARSAPLVDATVYANTTALTALCYLEAASVLGRPELRRQALGALDFLWQKMRAADDDALYHVYQGGSASVGGMLADYAQAIRALVWAYQHTADPSHLGRAEALAKRLLERFQDLKGGGFFDIEGGGTQSLGHLALPEKPLGDNVVAADGLLRLYQATMKADYREAAERALSALAAVYQDYGEQAAGFARVVNRYLNPPLELTVVGRPEAPETQALVQAACSVVYPSKEFVLLHPDDQEALDARGYEAGERPVVYACVETACLPPISAPSQLRQTIQGFLASCQELRPL
ncbi:MAG: thioredoxin domain-containing protein [Chloroflexi bacterium]|nr:thioredoxin domain-containing protein [Chloroflexota bacterium]